MSDDDFLDAMSDVQQIKQTQRIVKKNKNKRAIHQHIDAIHEKRTTVQVQRSESGFSFQEKGLSMSKMKRIGSTTKVEATLDLHGMYVQDALDACVTFIKEALHKQRRLVRIIHGRGLHSHEGKAVLRKEVFRWLKDGSYTNSILAVEPEKKGGASLVYLRRQR